MKDEILSYQKMCKKIGVERIQKGMSFHIKEGISVVLMSVRPDAPYDDEIDYVNNLLIYEGHDVRKFKQNRNPKIIDQPIYTAKRTLTENGKFINAVENYKKGFISPEKILVFEKLKPGIWSEKGLFSLIDYETRISNGRKVFKFILKYIDEDIKIPKGKDEEEHNKLIPKSVKVAVWKRDNGKCVLCGTTENLYFDHDLPFSKSGSSITEKNVRILCNKCILKKHDKIK